MEITEVKVFPVSEDKLKAFVSVVIDQCFMVNDIKIIQGRQGLFISMPSRKKKNGEFKDVAHPLNNETRRMIEGKVLTEYERVLEERDESPGMEHPAQPGRFAEAPSQPRQPPPEGPPARPRNADVAERRQPEAAEEAPGRRQAQGTSQPSVVLEEAARETVADTTAMDGTAADDEGSGKSLEEVEEIHLRDSFWTVP